MPPENQPTSPSCPECGAALEPDGDCLTCAFSGALAADSSPLPEGEKRGFGDFSSLQSGEFGRYALKRQLGEGGMGVVWEAKDSSLKRTVALKAIRGFAFSSDAEQQRFHAEATAVAQLDHPNIVPIYDVGVNDSQPFFTMKHLKGGTLSNRLREGPLPAEEAVRIMEKLARAVHHAHDRGVLHRDLKPDNVLFDDNDEPHLSDFGLAKWSDSEVALTRPNAHVCTPQYMSPEQARGVPGKITTASDVWAAGALLYHMLTGRLPFPGKSPGEIFDRVANQDPMPMGRSSEQIDPQLETLCLRCLQKDPNDRLPSAEALADELKRWLAGQPIHAKQVASYGLPWRAIALALGCLVVAAVVFAVTNKKSEETGETADRSPVSKAAQTSPICRLETFSVDGDREGERFFMGWGGKFPQRVKYYGIIRESWDGDSSKGTYAFQIGWEEHDEGVALKVLNYHAAEEGKNYYLPDLTHEPVMYLVTDPLWNEARPSGETDIRFVSFQHADGYLKHSGHMLFNHALYKDGRDERSERIFEQDSTWGVHELELN